VGPRIHGREGISVHKVITAAGSLGVFLLLALLCSPLLAPARATSKFPDVSSSDWFAVAVEDLAQIGVVGGHVDGSFRPYAQVTRAQFVVMLSRSLSPLPAGEAPFTDMEEDAWYAEAVGSLFAVGLVQGSGGKLNPEQGISRQQAVSLVMRALSYKLQATGAGNSIGVWIARGETALWLRGFRDRYRIVSPHDLAVGSALRLGIVKGRDDGMFSPETFLTRGQAAGLLHRSLFNPVTVREVPPDEVPPIPLDIVVGPGAREDAVEALEAQLESLGYFFGTPDKLFDRRTEEAVIGFQKVSGLNRTGVVDAGFWKLLWQAERPQSGTPGPGNRVEIDLARQVLFLVESGEVVRVVPVSTGRYGLRTPSGSFSVLRKIPRWRESELGWLYKPAYVYGGIAIHGYVSVPVYPASHGCIRVATWTMDELYPKLPVGLRVLVY